MKTIARLLLLIFFCVSNLSLHAANLQLKGFLQAPETRNDVPPFRIFFAGRQTTNDKEGLFTFPLEQKLDEYYLLVCGRFHHNFEKTNTVKDLGIHPGKHHRFFRMYKTMNPETAKMEWAFVEKKFEDDKFVTPHNTVILMLNPAYLDKVVPWTIGLPTNYTQLPKLVLRDNIRTDLDTNQKRVGKGTLDRASRKSLTYTLNHVPFHKGVGVVKNKQGSSIAY